MKKFNEELERYVRAKLSNVDSYYHYGLLAEKNYFDDSFNDTETIRESFRKILNNTTNLFEFKNVALLHTLGITLFDLKKRIERYRRNVEFSLENCVIIGELEELINCNDISEFNNKLEQIGVNNIISLHSDFSALCRQSFMDTKKIDTYKVIKNINGINVRDASVTDFSILINVVRNKAEIMSSSNIVGESYLENYDKHNNYYNQGSISLSAVNSSYLGLFARNLDDVDYIFGYQGYNDGFITSYLCYDDWSEYDSDNHTISDYGTMNCDMNYLINNSFGRYNEVVSFRRNEVEEGSVLKPSGIICIDKVNSNAIKAAKKFNVDILLLDTKKLAHFKLEQLKKFEHKANNSLDDKLYYYKLLEQASNMNFGYFKILNKIYVTPKLNSLKSKLSGYYAAKIKKTMAMSDESFEEKLRKYLDLYEIYMETSYLRYSSDLWGSINNEEVDMFLVLDHKRPLNMKLYRELKSIRDGIMYDYRTMGDNVEISDDELLEGLSNTIDDELIEILYPLIERVLNKKNSRRNK